MPTTFARSLLAYPEDRPGQDAAAIILWYWFRKKWVLWGAHPENKVLFCGVLLATRKHAADSPRLPRKLPQLHQRNTTQKTHKSAKPPAKTQESPPHTTSEKNQPLKPYHACSRLPDQNPLNVPLLLPQQKAAVAGVSMLSCYGDTLRQYFAM